jgi:hypothetical protein
MKVLTKIASGLLVAILAINSSLVLGQQSKKALTNDDVIMMVKGGLEDTVIVLKIQQSPANYDTSVEALVQLKKQGVSRSILEAMLEAEKVKNSNRTEATAPSESKKQQIKVSNIGNDFLFELDVCQSSGGDSVTCWLSITNKAQERELDITLASHIDDNLGEQIPATDVWIAGKNMNSRTDLFGTGIALKQGYPMRAVLKFQKVKPEAKFIHTLRIVYKLREGKFHVDLHNIPITSKPQSSIPNVETQREKQNDAKGIDPARGSSNNTNKSVEVEIDGSAGIVTVDEKQYSAMDSAARTTATKVESVRLPFKYRVKHFSFPNLREGLDLCAGTITIGKDHLEIVTTSDKSALGFKCDSNTYQLTKEDVQKLKDTLDSKWYEYRPTADYLHVKFTVAERNGNGKKKKEFYLYPAKASITRGTRTHTLTGKVLVCPQCPAIVCRDCKDELVTMKNLLDEFYDKEQRDMNNRRPVRIIQ